MIRTSHLPFPGAGTLGWNRDQINRYAWPYLVISLVVLLAWAAYSWVFPIPVFPIDDAYIVIHNARALLAGQDPNYIGSSPITGATSLVHLALVTFFLLFCARWLPSRWPSDCLRCCMRLGWSASPVSTALRRDRRCCWPPLVSVQAGRRIS
jgi:hypothetical protein